MVAASLQEYEEEDGAIIVARGTYARVLLFGEARDEFEQLMRLTDQDSVGACQTLKRYFQQYADYGPDFLTKKMYRQEGRQRVSGTNVLVHAFKGKHVRIYGVADAYMGLLCFCGTSCDPAKKQQKADPDKIKKAAKEWMRITDGK